MFYMTPHIADRFTKHLEAIRAIPFIDRGGCGFVALNIYKTLTRLGYNAKIISCNRLGDVMTSDETEARRNNYKGFDVAQHYVVRVGNIYFDSNGAFSFNSLCDILCSYDIVTKTIYKIDLEWAIDHAGWNDQFYKAHGNNLNQTIKFIEDHIASFKIGNNQNRNRRVSGRTHRLIEATGNCS